MSTLWPHLSALLASFRDVTASMSPAAADAGGRAARRPAHTAYALARARLLSAVPDAWPMPAMARSLESTVVSGA